MVCKSALDIVVYLTYSRNSLSVLTMQAKIKIPQLIEAFHLKNQNS